MGVLVPSFAPPSQSVLSGASMPVAAVFDSVTDQMTVIFDLDLVGTAEPFTAFQCRVAGTGYAATSIVSLDGNVLVVQMIGVAPDPGPDVSRYNVPPGELVDFNGNFVLPYVIPMSSDVPVPTAATYVVSQGFVNITFSEPIFINTAVKQDFGAFAAPNELTVQSISVVSSVVIQLVVTVNGPGSGNDRVTYAGRVDGIESGTGVDVPEFQIGLDIV